MITSSSFRLHDATDIIKIVYGTNSPWYEQSMVRLANRPGMARIIPELTHGVPCPGRGSFCPGNVKIDHRAWI